MQQRLDQHPDSALVVNEVLRRNPMHRKYLGAAIGELTAGEIAEADHYVRFMLGEQVSHDQLATAYLTIVGDTFREELFFREHGRYRYSTFAEANEKVYDNPTYMRDYMIGLALSGYWWPNHTALRRFFDAQLPRFAEKRGLYREVGPGHGMYFLEVMRRCDFDVYEGIDISETSARLTQRVVESGYFGSFPRARIIRADFLARNSLEHSDVLVMGEVLEHVENPAAFLNRAHETLKPDGLIFLTTCVNAPAVDHLYNPGSVMELERLFANTGLEIAERCVVPRQGTSIEQCERERLAINVAYVLQKA